MKSRAFTMVELLVVVTIISVLAALLFPVFTTAKLSAKGSVALSNLHQNYLAIQLYREDWIELPRGVTDQTLISLEAGRTVYGELVDPKLPRVRVADLLAPYTKNAAVFRSPRAPLNSVLQAKYGANYFGWGWDEQRAAFGPGPNFDLSTAALMREYVDYENPLDGQGRTACLFESGSAKMTGRMECLAGFRDIALE